MNNPCPEFWERYEAASQLSLKVEQELGLAVKDGKTYDIQQNLALIDTNLQGIQELWDTSKVTLKSGEKMFAPHYEALKQIFMDNYLPLESLEDSIELNETGGIDRLDMSRLPVVNLNSFKYLSTLRKLLLVYCRTVSDISPLAALRNLENVCLAFNEVSDMSPLANLTKLRVLNLDRNKISDISALRNLNNLTTLQLSDNQIVDISPLSNLLRLEDLELGKNQIEDFTHIQQLTSMKYLNVNDNPLKDLEVCSGLINLKSIIFRNCQIESLSPLVGLPSLIDVNMRDNNVRDLSPLTQIPQLQFCNLLGNPGSETVKGGAVILALRHRGVIIG